MNECLHFDAVYKQVYVIPPPNHFAWKRFLLRAQEEGLGLGNVALPVTTTLLFLLVGKSKSK